MKYFRKALTIGVVLAACMSASAQEQELPVGVVGPFTGPTARIGQDIRNGTEMAIQDATAAGELPVVVDGTPQRLKLVWVDDESSPEKAVKAFQSAVANSDIKLLLNGWHGSVGLALIDIVDSYKMLSFGNLAAPEDIANKINEKHYTHWFKGWPAPRSMSGLYVDAVEDFIAAGKWTPSNKVAAIVVEDSDWGRTWGDAILAALQSKGWDVVSRDVVKADESEFSALLTTYRAKNASFVAFSMNSPASAAAFVKQFYNTGLKALLAADGLGWSSEWYQMTGEASDYVISMDSPRVITDQQREWSQRYHAAYGSDPAPASAGHAYDYTRMLIKGLKAAGTLDRAKLSEALLNQEYRGVWQFYAFAKTAGDHAISPYEVKAGPFMEGFSFPMVQYLGGEAKVVWPEKYRQAEFSAPGE
ncbi:MAG TPA: ABC transporter substrate-binding protein [Mesorhizobium sp.]|jgi:branched-chain amino acid transport system substrate-binding protein|uniref:ABC transporter substrate-binding protein n=1 Tax=Mesorhizobium sp. TaxID=1871066 RepID=UPI002DDCB972|nr:ABC transporter substrate-binding protein [Mesorhizobium sp.]HEV2501826.1 ABC transporter substrate-binding protein [Mesorhizobium sp.]